MGRGLNDNKVVCEKGYPTTFFFLSVSLSPLTHTPYLTFHIATRVCLDVSNYRQEQTPVSRLCPCFVTKLSECEGLILTLNFIFGTHGAARSM